MSVTCRKQTKTEFSVSPHPNLNSNAICDEDGIIKHQICEPVALSLAEDFSVMANAASGKTSATRYRVSGDLVDMEDKLNKLI